MQTITLIVIGKLGQPFLQQGCAEYAKRLSAFCNFRVVELAEETIHEKSSSENSIAKALSKEAEKIFAALPKGAELCALCIEGKSISSEELAGYFAEKALSGSGDIALVIGSSHGLADSVKQRAAKQISMSRMTFPHQLARLLLTEQIYRACTINANVKYHK
ncbi:MAG: 23S rRNA (pseudouridine(1915)-N(3))-methyltransferase RlmH [Pygmaiobacter sp.]